MRVRAENSPTPGNPLVSVIVPVHNGGTTLPDCLEAIFRSDYPEYELIIVDDHSTDESASIVGRYPCTVVSCEQRGGAAAARNTGAQASRGHILVFTDSDVVIQSDTISSLVAQLLANPQYSAVFGSYTAETIPDNFFSIYKNLVHHFTHQTGREEASTFWAGCGAIWDEAFFRLGGFDPSDTASADVEDIALGYRLVQAGHRIRLAKRIQVTHAKYYSFTGLLKSDIFHRAIPWTKLMLSQRMLRNDLNTRGENLFSTTAVYGLLASLFGAAISIEYALLSLLFVVILIVLNRGILGLFLARQGLAFTLKAFPMTALFYAYCALGAAMGLLIAASRRGPPAGRPAVCPRGLSSASGTSATIEAFTCETRR